MCFRLFFLVVCLNGFSLSPVLQVVIERDALQARVKELEATVAGLLRNTSMEVRESAANGSGIESDNAVLRGDRREPVDASRGDGAALALVLQGRIESLEQQLRHALEDNGVLQRSVDALQCRLHAQEQQQQQQQQQVASAGAGEGREEAAHARRARAIEEALQLHNLSMSDFGQPVDVIEDEDDYEMTGAGVGAGSGTGVGVRTLGGDIGGAGGKGAGGGRVLARSLTEEQLQSLVRQSLGTGILLASSPAAAAAARDQLLLGPGQGLGQGLGQGQSNDTGDGDGSMSWISALSYSMESFEEGGEAGEEGAGAGEEQVGHEGQDGRKGLERQEREVAGTGTEGGGEGASIDRSRNNDGDDGGTYDRSTRPRPPSTTVSAQSFEEVGVQRNERSIGPKNRRTSCVTSQLELQNRHRVEDYMRRDPEHNGPQAAPREKEEEQTSTRGAVAGGLQGVQSTDSAESSGGTEAGAEEVGYFMGALFSCLPAGAGVGAADHLGGTAAADATAGAMEDNPMRRASVPTSTSTSTSTYRPSEGILRTPMKVGPETYGAGGANAVAPAQVSVPASASMSTPYQRMVRTMTGGCLPPLDTLLRAAEDADWGVVGQMLDLHPTFAYRASEPSRRTVLHAVCSIHRRGGGGGSGAGGGGGAALDAAQVPIVEILLALQADPNALDAGGVTPLTLACIYQNWDVCDVLLKNGGDLNAPCTVQVHTAEYRYLRAEHPWFSFSTLPTNSKGSLVCIANDFVERSVFPSLCKSLQCTEQSKIPKAERTSCMVCRSVFAYYYFMSSGKISCVNCKRIICQSCCCGVNEDTVKSPGVEKFKCVVCFTND
jgi:hypothetical protein